MSGLTQLELDALCCCEESAEEPSSPLGSALLVRKRQRGNKLQASALVAIESHAISAIAEGESSGSGLSQAQLDAMCSCFEGPDDEPSSPVGSALLTRKRQRGSQAQQFAAPALEQHSHPALEESESAEPGLSQLQLDDLCTCFDGPADEPSSPVGSALLARKRQRGSQSERAVAFVELAHPAFGETQSSEPGLPQAELDQLSVEQPPDEDGTPSSPIGASLLCIKTRRRWDTTSKNPTLKTRRRWEEKIVDIKVTTPSSSQLRCPASWGSSGGGLSQAELDAMCGDEAAPAPETEIVRQTSISCEEAKADLTSSPLCNARSPATSGHLARNALAPSSFSPQTSPCPSPESAAMRRRKGSKNCGYRADAENAGSKVTPVGSPNKAMDASPGNVETLSPRRSPAWRSNPLSPVGIN